MISPSLQCSKRAPDMVGEVGMGLDFITVERDGGGRLLALGVKFII